MCNSLHIVSGAGRPPNVPLAKRAVKVDGENPNSLRVLFAAAHTNPTAKRRTQVLRERQRVRNRSELWLLLDGPAYPELGYRQHLTTWKATCPSGHTYRCKCDMVRRPVAYLREKRMDGARRGEGLRSKQYSLRVLLAAARKPSARRASNRVAIV